MPLDGQQLSETGKVLLKAAGIVRERWCQGAYVNHFNQVCFLGAIAEAKGLDPFRLWDGAKARRQIVYSPEGKKALRYLASFREYAAASAMQRGLLFNDAPGRTAEEVAQALEAAAFMEE